MGKWKKAVAALAAVPMLMALAPAANAVNRIPPIHRPRSGRWQQP